MRTSLPVAIAALLVLAGEATAGPLPEGPRSYRTTWPILDQVEAFPLETAGRAGTYVVLSARVGAQDVGKPPHPWNGIKVMLKIDTPDGTVWPQLALPQGTFDPQDYHRRIFLPPDMTGLTLILGLEQVAGRAVIDRVRVETAGRPPEVPSADPARRVDPGHGPGRLRGAMTSPLMTRADLEVLAGWGANLIRWQLIRPAGQPSDLASWDLWAASGLEKTDQVLGWARDLGMKVVLDLHSPPGGADTQGGYQGALGGFFTDPAAQARFVSFWAQAAARYRGHPALWGFDLVNEPDDEGVDLGAGCLDWQALAEQAGRAIRAVDPDRVLIVQPADWGGPRGFLRFRPLDLDRVVYSFHDYYPMTFTHQGVFAPSFPVAYPGIIDGAPWTKETLSRVLEPARVWSRKYRLPLYVGEFGAIRWAPGADRWFRDQIELFEAEGWDWSYHAFREWQGWSLEEGDRARLGVLKAAFDKNKEAP